MIRVASAALRVAFMSALAAAMCAAAPRAALAQAARYAVVVQSVSGGEEYATQHRAWLDDLVKVLRGRFGLDAQHLVVLAEQPGTGEQKATAENVRATFGRLAGQLGEKDLLFVMLIGHGGGQGNDARFNLVGPDLDVADWRTLLEPVRARITFVDATAASFAFLAGLAAPNRVIITATSTMAAQYHTIFAQGFIAALSAPAADADKNGRVSMWEAFTYASDQVKRYYEENGTMATEHSVLDDDGDGKGRLASDKGTDGTLSSLTYLDAPAEETSSDPEIQALIKRRDALAEQVDELRRRRASMPDSAFEAEFEKLIIDLSVVSRDIRRRTGG